MTWQEIESVKSMEEQLEEFDVVYRPRKPVLHGYSFGTGTPAIVYKIVREIEAGEWDEQLGINKE
jgi:hypothetical protein